MKKIFSVLLTIAVLLSMCQMLTLAEEYEFVKNGSFEAVNAAGVPENWTLSGKAGENFTVVEDAKDGTKAVKMYGETDNVFVVSRFTGLVGGKTYALSAALKAVSLNGTGALIKFEFKDASGNPTGAVNKPYTAINKSYIGISEKITVPAGTTDASLLLRLLGGGEIYWDAVSFKGERAEAKESEVVLNSASGSEFVVDGGFETDAPGFSIPAGAAVVGAEKKVGEKALHMKSEGENITAVSRFSGLVGGKTYTLSFYMKSLSFSGTGPFVKMEFRDKDGNNVTPAYNAGFPDDSGVWLYKSAEVKVPENATDASLLIRLLGAGEMYWDEVSFKGEKVGTEQQVELQGTTTQPEAPKGDGVYAVDGTEVLINGQNMIPNGDLEEKLTAEEAKKGETPGQPKNWRIFPSWDGYFEWVTDDVAKGSQAVRIHNTDPLYSPYLAQTIPVLPNTEYQLYTQYRSDMVGYTDGSLAFKVEYYKDTTDASGYIQGAKTQALSGTEGKWQYMAYNFTTPAECNLVTVLIRLWQCGDVVYDNIGLVHRGNSKMLSIKSSETFVYPDRIGEFTVTATPNVMAFPELANTTVDFTFKKEDAVLNTVSNVALVNGEATAKFDFDLITELKAPYTITAAVKDASGKVLETADCLVYKFARPKYLDAQGNYIGDGSPMKIMSGYRYLPAHAEKAYPAGFNVAQVAVSSTFEGQQSIDYVKGQLDALRDKGIKAFVCLYRKSYPAGHPNNIENAKLIVETFKDDPVVFAWGIADEIFTHMPDPYDSLRDSYVAIRTIDDNHPVLINEATDRYQRDAALYADILSVDPYPANHDDPTYFPSLRVNLAREAVDYDKPIICILQGIDYMNYWPTGDDTRSMIYQAFFAGATGVGFYQFTEAKKVDGKSVPLTESDIWPYIDAFGRNEKDIMFEGFVFGDLPVFCEARNDTVWYTAFAKDGSLYVPVLNRQKTDVTYEIKLSSPSGLQIGGFTGEVIGGIAAETFTGNGNFTAKVNGGGATMYKITPKSADFSTLLATNFRDLYNYDWAREAIVKMENAGIASGITPTAFAPGKAITRGDFAMFLVNALGLDIEPGENFADVKENADYSRAVAIGRAAGILKGVGDNRFNPEAEITRQDLMVICARGMRLKKELGEGADISGFPDNALIADYAVADIAAMVRVGIVKGNADGTINPLGNTTRAEAAVIMDRIVSFLSEP
ncbi:MAG: hypothetical protein E7390_01040 [Ruminococcaceae bacterium]|nr:hypothetical protein [Oscillospiraceae bacterium]